MSYSGDAAEQVVRMSLEGAEVVLRLAGDGAEKMAALIYAILMDQNKTKGKARLSSMIRSGKELKVFAVKDNELVKFCQEAKKYGVLYTVLKDRDANDGITDVMVRAEDASKVNRIFERFNLSTVDMASVQADIENAKAERGKAVNKAPDEKEVPEHPAPKKDKADEFLDELFKEPEKEEHSQNPIEGPMAKSRQSGPSSGKNSSSVKGGSERTARPSVKEELNEIREEIKKGEKKEPIKEPEHKEPKRKKYRKKGERS